MNSALDSARTFLFVPASRPERFAKALATGADCIILDLEDAVAPEQKTIARQALDAHFGTFPADALGRTLVRINAAGTPWHDDDIGLLEPWVRRGLLGAMVAKAESADTLNEVANALGAGARLVPLIESLAGLDDVTSIVQAPQVARIAFGHLDFQRDLGMQCGDDQSALVPARYALVAASRRRGLPAPIDGVTTETDATRALEADVQRARTSGFGGKLCIHPRQVAAVNALFAPSAAEVAWAQRVMARAHSHEGAAFDLDGQMVDRPVVLLAQRTLDQAARKQTARGRPEG